MSMSIYEEFLELVAIDGEERQRILPEWIKCCDIMGMTEEDVRYAVKEWLPKTQQIEYLGVRKVLGAFTRECIDHSKLQEYKDNGVKLVYGVLPCQTTTYSAIKKAGREKVFVSFPDYNLMAMAQCFFNKGYKFFELAENAGMTYGARHCALNKMRVGGRLSGMVPTPDVDWIWGLVCDEASKIDEYIANMYDSSWKTVTTRIPHNVVAGVNAAEDVSRVQFLGKELRRSMNEVEEIIGIKVSDEAMAEAVGEFNNVLQMSAQLTMLATTADPQPLTLSTLQLVCGSPATFPMNTGFDYYIDGMKTLLEETKQAVMEGRGVLPKGAPKVGIYFVPWAIPWVEQLFIDNGVILNLSVATTLSPKALAPSNFEDPYEQAAEAWLRNIFTMGCHEEVQDWIEKVQTYKPEGFIAGFLDYDRWIGALHKRMARQVEEATGVTSFYLEADFYDGRDYSAEALRTRVESICQIIKTKHAQKIALEAAAPKKDYSALEAMLPPGVSLAMIERMLPPGVTLDTLAAMSPEELKAMMPPMN